ncbi:hypothetical protein QTP70_009523 [Hemibagrus guttatus]|uniref:Uncharacterized protein n=1 Tax=Hemibagrus guttatus TaxID=175788 RepID=A0AAE0Q7A2_9TELE|nr:hypothetical protein QTP70_009523 [Hemibagrus guttatus]
MSNFHFAGEEEWQYTGKRARDELTTETVSHSSFSPYKNCNHSGADGRNRYLRFFFRVASVGGAGVSSGSSSSSRQRLFSGSRVRVTRTPTRFISFTVPAERSNMTSCDFGEREKGREREREQDRKRERESDRKRGIEREGETDRKRGIEREGERQEERNRERGRATGREE